MSLGGAASPSAPAPRGAAVPTASSEEERVLWRDELTAALSGLPPLLREAFLLKHMEELSYEEMAEVTGNGVSALKMRVSRACAALRGSLQEALDDR